MSSIASIVNELRDETFVELYWHVQIRADAMKSRLPILTPADVERWKNGSKLEAIRGLRARTGVDFKEARLAFDLHIL